MRTNKGTEVLNNFHKGMPQDPDDLQQWFIDKTNNIKSVDELRDYVFGMTMGMTFPFNPPSPLREAVKQKIEELDHLLPKTGSKNDREYLIMIYKMVKDEWKKIELPPGAMY